ncbi:MULTISPECIES: hypothetical protein [Yersinia]|uniref:Flippase n=2 Tax=Yersinia bercovieri TaxID=634 RepID=A0A2G4U2F3_YERBE|nr:MULTISPECIES: hypothetical protein [Yersinia]EEQ05000.1 hypothetical protein yberc0001_39810 [Yersinia bercovieri ATCC 43970]MDN0103038.1 hypothetical protein [Yersinia bercovieri]PHZ27498.1 hypothetical protein CS533_11280 [Yersinia bercovieri]QDW34340.1 hypothetical protein FFE93_015575 [Yersinia sp. KBS0713]QKJ07456.1 hypothetical protein HRK25_11480 [Yersinia bercovieri ATCC 43970]
MKNSQTLASKISEKTSIDYHVGVTLLLRLWTIAAGGILIVLIPLYLTAPEQGYFFTFASLIAMQVFFELGFNYVVVQFIGHEMAHVTINNSGSLEGNSNSISRIYSLISLLKRWYTVISLAFFVAVFFAGFYFFKHNGSLAVHDWLPGWALLVFFSSINLFISPFLAVLEGMGFVGQVATIRLIQSIVGYSVLSILLICKLGLIAIPAITGAAALFSTILILKKYGRLLFRPGSGNFIFNEKISWYKEIFPFQWRIALSWLSGYFIFQLFNPMLFAHQGAIEAGRIGLTLAIFSAMLSLSMSWVTAKSPTMARLIAENKKIELNKLFISLIMKSGILNFLISISFLIFVLLLKTYSIDIVSRVASIEVIVLLFTISLANHAIFSMAAYMRCHKEEPMIWNSLSTGFIALPLIYIFSQISSFATIASYGSIMIFVSLPWCYLLFRKYYNHGVIKGN